MGRNPTLHLVWEKGRIRRLEVIHEGGLMTEDSAAAIPFHLTVCGRVGRPMLQVITARRVRGSSAPFGGPIVLLDTLQVHSSRVLLAEQPVAALLVWATYQTSASSELVRAPLSPSPRQRRPYRTQTPSLADSRE